MSKILKISLLKKATHKSEVTGIKIKCKNSFYNLDSSIGIGLSRVPKKSGNLFLAIHHAFHS